MANYDDLLMDTGFTPFTAALVEDLTSRLHSAYSREDALSDYTRMEKAGGAAGRSSAYNHRKQDLVTKLNAAGFACSAADSPDRLKELITRMPTQDQVEARMYQELFEIYSQFPTASAFMERTVRRLADPDFREDPVRTAIVKQFLRHTNYNTLAVCKMVAEKQGRAQKDMDREDVIRYVDESIFDILDMPLSRDERRKYALIRLADDLAGGKFRTSGKTKTDLYMFAFAFGMTAFTGLEGEQMDPERDLEKNLFRDFYNDNLLRYISDDFTDNVTAYEQEPSGEGINYKNFAEVIYLYYLNRPGMKPRKRLSDANALIEKCVKLAKDRGLTPKESARAGQNTEYYHTQFLQRICQLSPEELTDFICGNYVFPEDIDAMANIMVESQRRTAARVYDDLLSQVLEHTGAEELEELDYGLDLHIALEEYAEDDPFRVLMEKLNQMLSIRFPSPVSGTGNEYRLTRTALVALFAYHYHATGQSAGMSLPRMLRNFRTMIDPLLVQSRFQPISEKNIFDVFTIVALYHLNSGDCPRF